MIHRIVVEETPAELSCPPPPSSLPKAPSTACAGIQTERVAGPGVAPPIVGLVTPGAPQCARPKGDRSVRSMQLQLKCLANGELESKVIPGRTNNEVIEMRKQLLEQGYMNCIYEVCCSLCLFPPSSVCVCVCVCVGVWVCGSNNGGAQPFSVWLPTSKSSYLDQALES